MNSTSSPPAKRAEAFPDAALRPAYKAVVERLLRSVDHADSALRHGRSRSPGDCVNARHAARIRRQSGPIRAHCASENQKKSDNRLLAGNNESCQPRWESPLMGPVTPRFGGIGGGGIARRQGYRPAQVLVSRTRFPWTQNWLNQVSKEDRNMTDNFENKVAVDGPG